MLRTMKHSLAILLFLLVASKSLGFDDDTGEDGAKINYDRALFHDEDDDEADLTSMRPQTKNSNVEATIEPVVLNADTSGAAMDAALVEANDESTQQQEGETNRTGNRRTSTQEGEEANNNTVDKDQSMDPSKESKQKRIDEVDRNETPTYQHEEHANEETSTQLVEGEVSSNEISKEPADDKSDIVSTAENHAAVLPLSSDATDNSESSTTQPYKETSQEIDSANDSVSSTPNDMAAPQNVDTAGIIEEKNANLKNGVHHTTTLDTTAMSTSRARSTKLLSSLVKSYLRKKSPVHADYCSRPPCGFWGDPKRETLVANITILDRIVNDTKEQNQTVDDPVLSDESDLEEIVAELAEESKETVVDELVEGLDDLDKLFQGVTTPDEFDVASNGSTIQEVLMGSATRVIFKRISVGAKIARTKTLHLLKKIARRMRRGDQRINAEMQNGQTQTERWSLKILRNVDGKLAPFRSLRDESGNLAPLKKFRNRDGEFAPLQIFRNSAGEFAPLQPFRNPDGKFIILSKQRITNVIKSIGRMLLSGIRTAEALVDRLFEGNSNEEEYIDEEQIWQRLRKANMAA